MFLEAILDAPALRLTIAELLAASLPDEELNEVETLIEASVRSLWGSAVKAFPKTRRRQHVIDRVKTETVKWQAFPGLKIVLASARVLGERYTGKYPREQRRYRTNLMFREAVISQTPKKGMLKITAAGSSPTVPRGAIYFEKLSFDDSVRVRCNCPDFQYRFNWECDQQTPSALFGPKAPPYVPKNPERYRGPINPSGLPGICKHAMNMGLALYKAGVVKMKG